MDDVITVAANLSTKGFDKGTKAMQRAINSLSRTAQQMGRSIGRGATTAMSSFKRLVPLIIGAGSAYGILSKAVSAFMSQNEQLSSKMNSIWTALGNVLAPILTQIINWVTTAVSYLLEFLRLLGLTGKTASQLSKKASGAAGQLQKTIAGFDELNLLQDNSGGGGGGGATLDDVEPSEWMKKLAELLKNKMWDEAADMIIEKMNGIIKTIHDKAYDVGNAIGEYLGGIIHVIARVLDEVNWKELGQAIAEFFNGIFNNISGEDLGKILVAKFTIAFKIVAGFLEDFNWVQFGNIISDMIISALDAATRAINQADFKKIGQNIASFFNNIDWVAIANAIYGLLITAWDGAVEFLHSFLTTTNWDEVGEGIRAFFKNIDWAKVAQDIYLLLKDAWEAAWKLLLAILGSGEEEEPPIVEQFRSLKASIEELAQTMEDILGPLWNNLLKPILEWSGEFILPSLIDDLTATIKDISDTLKFFFEIFESLSRILTGDFSGGFNQAKDAVVGFFNSTNENKHFFDSFLEKIGLIKPRSEEASQALLGTADAISKEGSEAENTSQKLEHSKTTHQEATRAASEYHEEISKGTDAIAGVTGAQGDYIKTLDQEKRTLEGISGAIGSATGAVKEQVDANVTLAEKTTETAQAGDSLVQSTTDLVGTTKDAESASKDLSGQTHETGGQFKELESVISDSSKHMKTEFEAGMTDMGRVASEQTQDMNNVFAANFDMIASNAFYWGQDVIYSFTNGLINAVNSVLIPTMENIAMAIRNYIGFSEPKLGPLSDFHTFAPDMMKLFAQGIENTSGTVMQAVSDVTGEIADAFNNEYSIGANMAALDAIGSNVAFQMPVVAGGGVLPYSVGTAEEYGGSSEADSAVMKAIDRLSELVSDFHNDVQNMQWVLQFGKERAVVQEITRIQKQMEKAGGR